ncbi:MAG: hypothetical protein H7281_03185 [Bacteriovorax sp.]|nr:hypothetical protein [Bacteriovorax sp.]
MNFKEYLADAWSTHATNPRKVADEFKQNFNLMESEEDVTAITRLIVHVCGEHLGEWMKGIELLRKLKNNATIKDPSEMNRYMAILNLGNNPNTSIDNFSPSDQARIYASTASALSNLGGLKNAEKFIKLSAEIISTQLTKEDPANKALAMASHSVACNLEEKKDRNESDAELMILASNTSRKFWEIAGTWKEIERAEYRLSQTYLQAGLLNESLLHAQTCLEINSQNNNEPLEIFFGYEAVALASRAMKNDAGYNDAVLKMKIAFSNLSADDQSWCKAELDKIQ